MQVYENTINEEDSVKQEDQMDFDKALDYVGASHYYQKRSFLLFGLEWFFVKQILCGIYYSSWILFAPVFLIRDPNVDCQGNIECLSKCEQNKPAANQCLNYICDNSLFDFVQSPYVTTAFDQYLNCNESLKSFVASCAYIGSLIGFFVFSFVGDNYGRRISLIISWFVTTVGVLCIGVNQHKICRWLLLGYSQQALAEIHQLLFIMPLLMSTPVQGHFRDIQNVGVQVFFAFGEFAIIAIAQLNEDWRILSLFWISIPIVVLNVAQLFIYESPAFLYSKSKRKCVKVLNKIAKINSKQELKMYQLEDNPQMRENNRRVYSVYDLFKYPSLRFKFIAGFILFFAIQVVYYGISFVSEKMGAGFYANMYIVAAFELIAYIVTDFLVIRLERKKWIIIGFLAIGVLSLPFISKSEEHWFLFTQTTLAGIMRFLICIVWALTYVYISELFPAVVRSLALGLISAGGAIGSILQTYLINWSNALNMNPMLTFGLIGAFCALFAIPLKETLNQPLLNKIEEDDQRIKQSMVVEKMGIQDEDDGSQFQE